jgi:hypothetical protein
MESYLFLRNYWLNFADDIIFPVKVHRAEDHPYERKESGRGIKKNPENRQAFGVLVHFEISISASRTEERGGRCVPPGRFAGAIEMAFCSPLARQPQKMPKSRPPQKNERLRRDVRWCFAV